ncbi:MAG: hypothetical protein DRJ98_04220 [Thermoprotei archaeon]|nr:MAG: hypothetical protein DRJ98_04220 [Thermoprotei archaeon]RLF14781.1 MAG: hypothetical protein DRN06_06600 [Thermoprotei archaeon]
MEKGALMGRELTVHVGFDDTDSARGGCTTYLASLAAERLVELGARFLDYPNLVRLNPNVPWKTRGNGALCLRFKLEDDRLGEAVEVLVKLLEKEAVLEDPYTNPALAVLVGWPSVELRRLAMKAVTGIVKVEEALKVAEEEGVELHCLKEARGVVGALAALGETLEGDHTYELIAYRAPQSLGSPRKVDASSVVEMDRLTRPLTFNNLDFEAFRVLITPHGPDPVLYGVRGETAEAVRHASTLIKVEEPVERWTIFRTNQGTDAHLKPATVADAHEHLPVAIKGTVASKPRTIPGGHVVFTLSDGTGNIDCAAYEPTGSFRKIVLALQPGDEVVVYGGVRPPGPSNPKTINLEKLLIVKLTSLRIAINPTCKRCGAKLESMGKGKGYRCRKCGEQYPHAKKTWITKPRKLVETLYIPPPRAHRHLTKPYSRYGREKTGGPLPLAPLSPSQFLWVNPSFKKAP